MKKAIVTGGAGFIGSHLVDKLIEQGVEVIVIDNLSTGKKENINPKAKFFEHDIYRITHPAIKLVNSPFQIHKVGKKSYHILDCFNDTDVIFHMAALARVQPSIEDPTPYHDTNVTGTHNILRLANDIGIKKIVFSSSSSVYGNAKFPTSEEHPLNPMSPYALHKLIGEQYMKLYSDLYDLDTVSLRYFNVYGDRMALDGAYRLAIPIFASQIKEGKPCTINNDGEQRRDFTCVNDVVDANILVATSDKKFNGEVYNIGNGNNTSVNELVDMMGGEKSYGKKVIEPFETLASTAKIDLDLDWKPKGNLQEWMNKYKKEIGI